MPWLRTITAVDPDLTGLSATVCTSAITITLVAFSSVPGSWIKVRGVGWDAFSNIMGISPVVTLTANATPDHRGSCSAIPTGDTDSLLPWGCNSFCLQAVAMDQPATWNIGGKFVYYNSPSTMGLTAK